MTMMHHITLSNGVFAACGVVCKSDPTPNPSLGEGLGSRAAKLAFRTVVP